MNLFSGLESLGFTELEKVELYEKKVRATAGAVKESKTESLEDYLYEKSYQCAVCDHSFTDTTIKKSKARYMSSDTDLKPVYEPVDPLYYEIVMCKKCGYTATAMSFNKITERQCDLITKQITPKFKAKTYPTVLDAHMAIERYKLALLNAVVLGKKSGEKAYLCLKIAWLYRDIHDEENERAFLQHAYVGMKEAYSTETFPICGMDENIVTYLVAELARRLGDNSEAMKWIGSVIVRRNLNARLKDKALTVKEMIQADMKSGPPVAPVKKK